MLKRWGRFDKKGRLSLLGAAVSLILTLMLPAHSNADMLTIDEIIFQDGGVNSSVLAGTADASITDTTLTIVLTNTSTDVTGGGASTNLLSGIGFNLPDGVQVNFLGGASMIAITSGSTAIGFDPLAVDLNEEWGGTNAVDSGPFQDVTTLVVDTVVATLQAAIDIDFTGNFTPPNGGTANVNGPSFGLLSGEVSDTTAGGLEAIQDSVTLSLALTSFGGLTPGELLTFINDNPVVLAFGSPNSVATPGTPIPEPGTLLLIGSGLVGLGAGVWRRKKY